MRHNRRSSSQSSRSSTQSSVLFAYVQKLSAASTAAPVPGTANAYGAFTTTPSASSWLRSYAFCNLPEVSISLSYHHRRGKLPDTEFASAYSDIADDSSTPPDSPLLAVGPSISRTSSTDSYMDDLYTHNLTPLISDPSSKPSDMGGTQLHPILEAVEKASKLSCRTVCSSCLKSGFDYPRCPRCDEMWCSRECRLQGGKRHQCPARRM